jgi:chaperonin cofactor prefoldin
MNNKNQITAKIVFLTGRIDGLEKLVAMLQDRIASDQEKIDKLKAEIEAKEEQGHSSA